MTGDLRNRAPWALACAALGFLAGCLPSFPSSSREDAGPADSSVDGPIDAPRSDGPTTDGTIRDTGTDGPIVGVGDGGCDGGAVVCNGACVNLGDDPHNCGSCGFDCTSLKNVSVNGAQCVAGHCRSVCLPDYADCADAGDGCGTNIASANNCGACGMACGTSTPLCEVGDAGVPSCVGSCPSSQQDCSGTCTTTASDTNNCGTCGNVCKLANANATCNGSACAIGSCASGFLDCDSDAGDGCEVNKTTDSKNCGACGKICNLPNATSTCMNGACAVVQCSTNAADCNGAASDGCESNLLTDGNNCGACGHSCGGGQCVGGVCQSVVVVPTTWFTNTQNFYGVEVWALTPTASTLYFVADSLSDSYGGSAGIYSVSTTPGSGAPAAIATGQMIPGHRMAVGPSNLYWTTYGGYDPSGVSDATNGTLSYAPLHAGVGNLLLSGLSEPTGLVADPSGQVAYYGIPGPSSSMPNTQCGNYINFNQGGISSVALSSVSGTVTTKQVESPVIAFDSNGPAFTQGATIAVDKTYLAWATTPSTCSDSVIKWAPLAGGAVSTFDTGGELGEMQIANGVLYFIAQIFTSTYVPTIESIPLSNGNPQATPIAQNSQIFGGRLAIDSTYLYYAMNPSTGGGTGPGAIWRVRLDGTALPQSYVTANGTVGDFAVDSNFVYWSDSSSGIVKIAK